MSTKDQSDIHYKVSFKQEKGSTRVNVTDIRPLSKSVA